MKTFMHSIGLALSLLLLSTNHKTDSPDFPIGKNFTIRGTNLRFAADGHYHTYSQGSITSMGTYAVRSDTLLLTTQRGLYKCGNGPETEPGLYSWRYINGTLVLTPIQDSCEPRRFALEGGLLSPNKDEEVLLKLEKELAQAYEQGNVDFFKASLADDYEEIDANGKRKGRQQALALFSTRSTGAQVVLRDMSVRLLGTSAVVQGVVMLGQANVSEKAGYSFSDTFVWRNDRWQLIASQMTRLSD